MMKKMKTNSSPARTARRLMATFAAALSVTLVATLTACHPDDELTTGEGSTITVSQLTVGIETLNAKGAGRSAAQPKTTRTADAKQKSQETRTADPATGYDGVVKTQFADGDVLHIHIGIRGSGSSGSSISYLNATATYQGDAAGWKFDTPLVLPQDLTQNVSLNAFYDGKTDKYATSEQFGNAHQAAQAAQADGTFIDFLIASNTNPGSSTISPTGTLSIQLVHWNALVRLTAVNNNLGREIKSIRAVVKKSGITSAPDVQLPEYSVPLSGIAAGAEALCPTGGINDSNNLLSSFLVTLQDGTEFTVPVPTPPGSSIPGSGTGQPLTFGHSYSYRLTLASGVLIATPDGGSDDNTLQWTDHGQLLSVPAGYIPLYTAEDLRKVGDGTSTYTYTAADGTSQTLTYSLSANYILMADIDLTPATDAENWKPIGTDYSNAFTGRFNGNGHTITGMKIVHTQTTGVNLGFFGYANEAVIYNLHFQGATVTGMNTYAGTLAGYGNNATIALCSATDCTVTGTSDVGGLVGYSSYSPSFTPSFTRCYALRCKVTSTSSSSGGLVGYNQGILVACYASGCTATSTGTGDCYTGGLVGNNSATLYGCYATQSTASGGNGQGALIGRNDHRSKVISCYATNAPASASNRLISNLEVYEAPSDSPSYPTVRACISPLNTPSSDPGSSDPSEGDNTTNYGITYRDAGYAPLIDATALTSGGTSYATLTDVPTVRINTGTTDITEGSTTIPPGGIYVEQRTWAAASIWNNASATNMPLIQWAYEGDDATTP